MARKHLGLELQGFVGARSCRRQADCGARNLAEALASCSGGGLESGWGGAAAAPGNRSLPVSRAGQAIAAAGEAPAPPSSTATAGWRSTCRRRKRSEAMILRPAAIENSNRPISNMRLSSGNSQKAPLNGLSLGARSSGWAAQRQQPGPGEQAKLARSAASAPPSRAPADSRSAAQTATNSGQAGKLDGTAEEVPLRNE